MVFINPEENLSEKGLKSKTIILWGRNDVLGCSVEFMLASRNEWDVIRVSDQNRLNILIQEIEKVNPDIVIICQGDSASDLRLPMQLLQKCAGIKVITVSRENNSMDVYKKQKIWVKEASDLIATVEA